MVVVPNIKEKFCNGCGEIKDIKLFNNSKRFVGGKGFYCKTCKSREAREYRNKNRKVLNEKARNYRMAHKTSSRVVKKISIVHCMLVAYLNDGECMSQVYKNSSTKITFSCCFGHAFDIRFGDVIYKKQWCPVCSGNKKLDIFVAKKVAEKRQGACLSDVYKNAREDLLWECRFGHKWYACLYSIKGNNTWCPECRIYRTQGEIKNILEELVCAKSVVNFKGFCWLRNPKTNRKLEIDIWFPDIKLAVEYNGEQHYHPIERYGGEIGFKKTKYRDYIKNKVILKHKEEIKYFLRINYREKISKENILKKITSLGIVCNKKET